MGDDCLHAVAQAINDSANRPSDLTARYGGEEFVVILPNTDESGAMHVAETIRKAIMALKVPHSGSAVNTIVTLSLGVATIKSDEESSPKLLIKISDQALYKAKDQGRNRAIHQ